MGAPKDYKDYPFIDLILDSDKNLDKLFDDSTAILKKNIRGRTDYLNLYRPKNSAITI